MNETSKNNDNFRMLFEQAPLGYQSLDIDGNFLEVNQKWLDTFGYERNEVIGKWFGDFLTPEYKEAFKKNFKKFKDQGHIHSEFEMVHKNGDILFIAFEGQIGNDAEGHFKQTHCILEDITERKKTKEALKKIEWMLSGKKLINENFAPEYGDLSELNKNGLILSSVGKDQLIQIASEYLDLMETSSAVYEKNGDYALGLFSSSWCQLMDSASRNLCGTDNNKEALDCGKWLCHESCWRDASKKAIDSGKPADVDCSGGIRLYAVPIYARGKVIGAINFGYGEPPKDDEALHRLSDLYQVPVVELRKRGLEYQMRPQYIVDYAKKRVQVSAQHIGNIIELKLSEIELNKKVAELEETNSVMVGRELRMIELKEEVNELLKAMGKDEKYEC